MNELALLGGQPVRPQPFPPWPVHGARERELVLSVLESGNWSYDGPLETEFARRFAQLCGAAYARCMPNGTLSLEIALRALDIGPGDEVILAALSFTSPAWAVAQVGALPVFADVRAADWCIDPDSVRELITPATRALLVVHPYCQLADLDQLLDIARTHSLRLLEDCAHVPGSRWRGRPVGGLGDIGSFSFQQSKVMTAGEGGMLVTSDEALAHRIYGLRNLGRQWRPDSPVGFGGNYRITEFQAAVLLAQLERLDAQLDRKNANVGLFRERIGTVPGVHPLAAQPQATRQNVFGLSLRIEPGEFEHVPVARLVAALAAEGIPVRPADTVIYQAPTWVAGARERRWPVGTDPARQLGLGARCPVAERVAQHGLIIRQTAFLGTGADVDDIVAAFDKVHRHAKSL
jgi:L-glutamine:2-deoxy-scyllo-inosose/3-amino-2,3-dideoxy-scyllo-inosose aminotransferase